MKPSELIKVLQKAVDAGYDKNTKIFFDTETRGYQYHMIEIGKACFENKCMGYPFITLQQVK